MTEKETEVETKSIQVTEITDGKCSKEDCDVCNLQAYLGQDWSEYLKDEFDREYFKGLLHRLHNVGKFYPSVENVFAFSQHCKLEDIKAVIIGQDPYHGPGQAMGLSFSVPEGKRIPPSLRNIYKELATDIDGFTIPKSGDLTKWAKQGVLLLNNTLTVSPASAASHSKFGWDQFTTRVIEVVNDRCKNVVFLLWGRHSHTKGKLVDSNKHLILTAAHPSPLSSKGFFGCKHFSEANAYLKRNDRDTIDWRL